MAKQKSRTARWSEAATKAREAMDAVDNAASGLTDALNDLRSVQEEFEEWRDNLPENLQNSALGEKLQTVCDIDIESIAEEPLNDWASVESAVDDAENAELPLGFGRD